MYTHTHTHVYIGERDKCRHDNSLSKLLFAVVKHAHDVTAMSKSRDTMKMLELTCRVTKVIRGSAFPRGEFIFKPERLYYIYPLHVVYDADKFLAAVVALSRYNRHVLSPLVNTRLVSVFRRVQLSIVKAAITASTRRSSN